MYGGLIILILGNTPAYTGTTFYSTGRLHCGREYPRLNGAYSPR